MTPDEARRLPVTVSIPRACRDLYGISRTLGYELAAAGSLPGAKRLGCRWVVCTAEALAFLGLGGESD